ncbi:MAG: hypothetical protein ACE5ID_04690 [Acidobacteriota bacterium]
MKSEGSATLHAVISTLNNLKMGDLDRIARHLNEVRQDLRRLELKNLAAMVQEAGEAIERGDAALFRRRIQHVVSRLGHLRSSRRRPVAPAPQPE